MKDYNEWYKIVKPIIESNEFLIRKKFTHHDNSVYDHCKDVSYKAYLYVKNKKKHTDEELYNVSIAGLLHDFYPYAWQNSVDLKNIDSKYSTYLNKRHYNIFKKHGFVHARQALNNSRIYYGNYLNKRIENSILRHMFPLNIIPPKYKEGWIITYIDKIETMKNRPKIKDIPIYIGIKRKK